MNDYKDLIARLRSMDGQGDIQFNELINRKTGPEAADVMAALVSRVAELESRLEISPLHNVDGIMARDATIKLQDERIAELEAERDVWRNKYMDKIGQMDVLQEFASKLEAERAEREKQEPIATVGWDRNFMGVVWHGKDMPEKGVETLLYAAPPVAAPVRLTDEQAEKVDEAIREALGDAYDCLRVWNAWSYGTMGPDDFSQVAEDSDRVAEIRNAAAVALGFKVEGEQ